MIEKVLAEFNAKVPTLNTENLHIIRRSLNKIMVHNAMIVCSGNLSEASELLGITRASFSKYLGQTVRQWKKENGLA